MRGYTLIAAIDQNRVIGKNGGLPWPRIAAELEHFKQTTEGGILLMGRGTMNSIKCVLPGRISIVVTRTPQDPNHSHLFYVSSFMAAFNLCHDRWANQPIFVIGGQSLYEQLMDGSDKLIITHIEAAFAGDRHFPTIDPRFWHMTRETRVEPGPKTPYPLRICEYAPNENP